MSTFLLAFITVALILGSLLTYLSFRRKAEGAVYPWVSRHAGYDPDLWAAVYWVAKVLLATIGAVVFFMLTKGVDGAVSAILFTVLGFIAPDLFLLWKRAARKRKMQSSLSFLLDLVVSLLRAGLPVEDALLRAGTRGFENGHPLGEEVTRTARDIRAGVDRKQAFTELGQRVPVPEMRQIAAAFELSGRLGFGVSDILAAQADVQRDRRMELGRRRIDRALMGSLVPVMLCGLPLLALVIIVPAVVDLARTAGLLRGLL